MRNSGEELVVWGLKKSYELEVGVSGFKLKESVIERLYYIIVSKLYFLPFFINSSTSGIPP